MPEPEDGDFEQSAPESEEQRQEQRRIAAEQRQQPAAVVHAAVRLQGQEELRRPAMALAFSGLQTGLVISFSLVASAALYTQLPAALRSPLLWKLGYPVGFLFVVLGRMQLYTENTLIALLPVLHARRGWNRLAILWGTVLATNLLGSVIAAWFFAASGVLEPAQEAAALAIAHEALQAQGLAAFLKGIVGGWLIALMAWMLSASQHSRVLVIVIVTYLIAISGMTHVIAGSAETFFAVASGAAGLGDYLGFLLPTLLGNTLGGTVLVAMVNHGQIRSDRHEG